jgi:hypothetical protein
MRKDLLKFSVMLALAAVFCLPGMVSADYVHPWSEIIQSGSLNAQQTWDKVEALLVPAGTGTDPGLTSAETGLAPASIDPTAALAAEPTFDPSLQGIFSFLITYGLDQTGIDPFVSDWIIWDGTTIVGFDLLPWTPADDGSLIFAEIPILGPILTALFPPPAPVPLPPTVLLLGSGLIGLVLLHRRKRSRPKNLPL